MVQKNAFDVYFFNNLYDDKIIDEKTSSFLNRLYNTILPGKEGMQNNAIINGEIRNLTINEKLNKKFNMPSTTYSLHLNKNIIPFYSENNFFNKYGYENLFTSDDILNDHKVFNKHIYFYVNEYLIKDFKVVITKNSTTIFLVMGPNTINREEFEEIINRGDSDGTWTLFFSTRSDYYIAKLARNKLFVDNKIYLSKLSKFRNYLKPVKNNCWTMYISTGKSYSIMEATSVTLEEDSNGKYFNVPLKFKEYVYSKINVSSIFIVNEPECSGLGVYVNDKNSVPVFQIPYKKNPIPKKNFIIWSYDHETDRKFHPLSESIKTYYPNIYDFTRMIEESYYDILFDNSRRLFLDSFTPKRQIMVSKKRNKYGYCVKPNYDLYIEWIEPEGDCSAFDSYIQDYIDCYGNYYAEMVMTNQLPDYIKDYHPLLTPKVSAFDYFESELKGDYRAWKLSCIIRLLNDNPKRYDELFHILYYNIKEYLTKSYTYDSDPDIYTRSSVVNNKHHCDISTDLSINFKTPQKFLRTYTYYDKVHPISLFINGIFMRYSYAMKYGTELFVYFDENYIANNETITIDIEEHDFPQLSKEISFGSVDEVIDLKNIGFNRDVSLDNLIIYVKDEDADNPYLGVDDFDYDAKIDINDIHYVDTNIDDTAPELSTRDYLFDNERKLVVPQDYDCVILKYVSKVLILDNNESTQPVDLRMLNMTINTETETGLDPNSLLKKRLVIATTDFYQQKVFKLYSNELLELGYTYEFHNFKGKPSKNRFRIYVNGLRLPLHMFSIRFLGYDRDALVSFDESIVNYGEELNIFLQYFGYDEIVVFAGKIKDLKKTTSEILYLADFLDTPYDKLVYKIFIDGRRISDDQIKFIGQSNMIIINKTYYDFNDESDITIYHQKMDEDMYEYDSNSQFLDKVTLHDRYFRQYLIDKYNN